MNAQSKNLYYIPEHLHEIPYSSMKNLNFIINAIVLLYMYMKFIHISY
jgi:hypothetical protein